MRGNDPSLLANQEKIADPPAVKKFCLDSFHNEVNISHGKNDPDNHKREVQGA
jgi:hypothetical protein